MGEQANYRPPDWQAGTGRVSLDALETALGTARRRPAPGSEPGGDDAPVGQPEASDPQPGTNPGPPWPAVVATTVRLWLRRGTQSRLFRRHRAAALIALAATALVASGLAVFFIRQAGSAPGAGGEAARAGVPTGPLGRSPGAGEPPRGSRARSAATRSWDAIPACAGCSGHADSRPVTCSCWGRARWACVFVT